MNRDAAEEFSHGLGMSLGGGWKLIHFGLSQGAHDALGMTAEAWVTTYLGGYIRMPALERKDVVKALREEGLSTRAIAERIGVGKSTVDRDTGVPHGTEGSEDSASVRGGASPSVPCGTTPTLGPGEWDEDPLEAAWDQETALALGYDIDDDDEEDDEPEPAKPHVAQNSGDHEWYTPHEYIAAARAVMGGIDLDPASSDEANEVVGAAHFYTIEDDGLDQPWSGRVWMNPPYSTRIVDRFCTRLAREYREGTVTEAIALVNNATETNWFQEMASHASALCFPRGRIKFWHPRKEAAPLQGQAVVYLGRNPDGFRQAFVRFGVVR